MSDSKQKRQISIDEYSVASSPLDMIFNGTKLSTGTCFFWERHQKVFLVTNWHNLSGKNPITGQHLSRSAAEPNHVNFDIWQNRQLIQRGEGWQPLEDENGVRWLEHPTLRNRVDVVCLELVGGVGEHVFPMNERATQPLITRISDEVFILGYPLGIGVERFPIWKRASIASEIDININDLPLFYVDTASTSGMSGSPVIRRATGGQTEDGSFAMFGGPATRFIGVYSGRLATGNTLDAQLGMVWKADVINEIIDGAVRGSR